MCRTVVAPSGRHLCLRQRSSHSCGCLVRWSTACDVVQCFAAAAELGVEGVEGLRLQVPDRDPAEVGRDVVADVAAVEGQRVSGAVELAEVAVEQLVDRRRRARVAALGDLDPKPVTVRSAFFRAWGRARRPRGACAALRAPGPPRRTRARAGRRSAAPRCRCSTAPCCSWDGPPPGQTTARFATYGATRAAPAILRSEFPLVKRGAGGRDRTDDLPLTRRLLYH